MPLTEREQRVLDELERSLSRDDPKLAQKFSSVGPRPYYGRIAIIAAGVLAGMLVLILGAVLENPWVGVGGFMVMFAALAWGVSRRKPIGFETDLLRVPEQTPKAFNESRTAQVADKSSGFMDRLGDRWDRRQSDSR